MRILLCRSRAGCLGHYHSLSKHSSLATQGVHDITLWEWGQSDGHSSLLHCRGFSVFWQAQQGSGGFRRHFCPVPQSLAPEGLWLPSVTFWVILVSLSTVGFILSLIHQGGMALASLFSLFNSLVLYFITMIKMTEWLMPACRPCCSFWSFLLISPATD